MMTIKTRATIEVTDIVAVEYECQSCHAKSVRRITHPVKDGSNKVPIQCGNCNAIWASGASGSQELSMLLNLIGVFAGEESSSGFALRFEVSGLDEACRSGETN